MPIQELPGTLKTGSSTTFLPTSISGCSLWLDGKDPAGTGTAPSTGATVSTWVDKAAAKNATATGSPTYVAGGGINFNGSAYFLNQTFTQNLSQRSIFIVMQETTRQNVYGVFSLIPTPSSGSDFQTITGLSVETTNGLRFYANGGGYFSDIGNTSLLVKAVYNDNMNGTTGSGFVNGTNATNVNASYTAGTCSGYSVGSRWLGSISTSYALNGVIYEILFFNRPLGVSDRRTIEGYLAQRWGLITGLPSGHPGITNNYLTITTAAPQFSITSFPRPNPIFIITENPPPPRLVLISNGLVSRWLLNESSGSTVIDSVGGNNITIGGSPSRASVTYGSYSGFALSLQTSTQVGSIPIPSNMNVTAHSMSSWVYFTGLKSGQQRWLSWGSGGGCPGEDFATYNDTLYCGPSCIYAYSFLTSGLRTGVWYFCTSTYNGTTWTSYLNGTQVQTGNSGLNAVNGSFSIGYNQTAESVTGGPGYGAYLGEIRFYNRALTAAEVLRIYQGTG
jgi:hypothetical protein